MTISREDIKNIIQKVISEDREPLKDILDHEDTEDVIHATHMAWDGGEKGETESENLVQPLDKAKAVGSDPVTKGLEVIDHPTGKVTSIEDRKVSLEEAIRAIVRSYL